MSSRLANKLTAEPVTKVDIFVSCHNLLNMDTFSKSDPCCVLYIFIAGRWIEHGRTEQIKNDLNPQFSKNFTVDYFFEEVQKIKFAVYDIDNTTPQLDDDDFLGQTECTLGELVSNSPLVYPLMKNGMRAGNGTIIVSVEQGKQKDLLLMKFSGSSLDKKDFFGLSDPFLEFNKKMLDGGYQVVHRTEYIKNTLDPVWKPFQISTSRLCNGNYRESVKVDCYDYNSNSSPDFIGSFETSVEELMSAATKPIQWPCVNPKKKAKKSSYKDSGTIHLLSCQISKQFSFLDFVFGGLHLKFCVAIDFTASNGNPQSPQSLHYLHPQYPNHYVRAIRSVGEVIKDYDSDQLFPCFGFGARIPPHMEVSHCFPLTFNEAHEHCYGIQGVLEAYYSSLPRLQLYGPTNFTPIIEHIGSLAAIAHNIRQSYLYYVLLIITDGVISDMSNTVRAIVKNSTLPLSIIIVGVGQAEFDAMDRLDSDDGLLRDQWGGVAQRDIVQFVPFRNFERASQEALAKQVLAELPDQVVSYYQANKIEPGKPRSDVDEQKVLL
ncbi:hypothetical protein HELRODRAFT_91226 [Helobdella robusta]|uniref:Copine-3 n=1 Tax=Helobdella robusta TaxID=6412 RepID=T1G811_HELRO|nr:hypothetical protein HELRODRAFT_91226 [Helobdella robusta]ESN89898.1 hypothetical protein HELRODRAFT_91226 [Helobdella robusta]